MKPRPASETRTHSKAEAPTAARIPRGPFWLPWQRSMCVGALPHRHGRSGYLGAITEREERRPGGRQEASPAPPRLPPPKPPVPKPAVQPLPPSMLPLLACDSPTPQSFRRSYARFFAISFVSVALSTSEHLC